MAHKIFPAELTIKSMKDSGYKDAAHAVAELIDNSIQAGLDFGKETSVEVICLESKNLIADRESSQIDKIAVFDDASGMTLDTLSLALAFGQGTRRGAQKGIGKFGMGLPNASISQCNRVDVWSWQDNKIHHTYLDINEIIEQEYDEVPAPTSVKELPPEWAAKIKSNIGESGTLVVWSNLDRLKWKRHKAFFANTEFIVGRMYRYFIKDKKCSIRMAAYQGKECRFDEEVKPNDPLYLMSGTNTPGPFDMEPAFDFFTEEELPLDFKGRKYKVSLKFSISKQDYRRKCAESGSDAGHTPLGKHCAKNQGISLVRAGRELELNHGFEIPYNPVERWWGVEVSFDPDLDEIFGVTNNKQSATAFAQLKLKDLADEEDMKEGQFRAFLKEENDIRLPIIEISNVISSKLSSMRAQLKRQTDNVRKQNKAKNGLDPAEKAASTVAVKDGQEGLSDKIEKELTEEEKIKQIEAELEKEGVAADETVKEDVLMSWLNDSKYIFSETELRGSRVIFDVSQPAGKIKVTINTKHPMYEHLVKHVEEENDVSYGALKLLLASWARLEDIESQDKTKKELLEDIRIHWGQIAKEMLDEYTN
ncbi:MAG: ATP-binding protein [Gammaproteobacteria bacterium]